MKRTLRRRFWIESSLATVTAGLAVVTLLWKDWIERAFRVDPDKGSGSLEWGIVAIALVATLVFSVLARFEWRGGRVGGAAA